MADPVTATNATSIILPTWDLIITLMLIVGIGYGIVLQREKIITTMVGVYVGMVVAQNWGPSVFKFFSGNNVLFDSLWIKANASPFTIKAILFGIVVVLITVKSDFARTIQQTSSSLSGLMVIAYSFLTTTLAISAVLSFLPASQIAIIVARSDLAEFIMDNYIFWIVLPIIALVIGGVVGGKVITSPEE